MKLISVVICTFNRAEILKDAISSVCNQSLSSDHFELIVVDNNSTDHTRKVVESHKTMCDIRYVFEARQGLSHARNRGWKEAIGKYVAYLDDDAKAPDHWLALSLKIISEIKPVVFGGPIRAYYNKSKPKWYKDYYAEGSVHLSQKPRPLIGEDIVYGGNLFCNRDVLQKTGGFNPKVGMTGKKIADGEEQVFQANVRRAIPNALIYTHPELYVYHLVQPKKWKWKWIIRYKFALGRYAQRRKIINAQGKIETSRFLTDLIYCSKRFFKLWVELLFDLRNRDYKKYPNFQNFIYEVTMSHISAFGKFFEKWLTP